MIRVMKIFQNVNKNYVIYGKNPLLSLQRLLLFVIMQWHVKEFLRSLFHPRNHSKSRIFIKE
jgi:hypothetical protein